MPPAVKCPSRSQRRKPWRERPRCARPTSPRACPEGSLTPWLSLSVQVVEHSMFGGEKRRSFSASNVVDCDHQSSGRSGRVRPDNVGHKLVSFARAFRSVAVLESGASRASYSMSTCVRHEVSTSGLCQRVGHHDNDAASVLGTVQGAALRSARACARPSGLDGACAQMISRHLRDGHRVLFPSGTNCSLIDPLDGLEKHSRPFDSFRKRAPHLFVEFHFL